MQQQTSCGLAARVDEQRARPPPPAAMPGNEPEALIVAGNGDGSGKRDVASVRRVKVLGLQWVQFPPGNWVAPAGSYRSGGGGNETVGAFETDVSLWRCSEQAGRNASERRAGLETTNVDADLALAWGRAQCQKAVICCTIASPNFSRCYVHGPRNKTSGFKYDW